MPTKIEWVSNPGGRAESWNPIRAYNLETGGRGHFCVHVSDGCKNCYAERLQTRFQNPVRFANQDSSKVELYLDQRVLNYPLHWTAPRGVFVCSMTDIFLENVPQSWLHQIFAVMGLAPQHTFKVLTKRHMRLEKLFGATAQGTTALWFENAVFQAMSDIAEKRGIIDYARHWPLKNVWLGVSAEDQKTANIRIPHLLGAKAARRFLSAEPLIGAMSLEDIDPRRGPPINALTGWIGSGTRGMLNRLDQVIVGGESGPKARHMDHAWALKLMQECARNRVAFFMKQMARLEPIPDFLHVRQFPKGK